MTMKKEEWMIVLKTLSKTIIGSCLFTELQHGYFSMYKNTANDALLTLALVSIIIWAVSDASIASWRADNK